MKLNQRTDYALRLLIYLAVHPDRSVTVPDLARVYGISAHHLAKVAQELVQAGWVGSTRGRGGGLKLAVAPGTIWLGEVIRRTERSLDPVACLEGPTSCPIESVCMMKRVLAEARDAFLAVIDRYTLGDLVERRETLVPLLLHGAAATVA